MRRQTLLAAPLLLALATVMAACAGPRGSSVSGPPAENLARVYYVNREGSDGNDGTSPQTAWRTIDRINRQAARGLHPGDQVVFHGGETFTGNLTLGPKDSGTLHDPVKFGSYGAGAAVLIPDTSVTEKGVRHGTAFQIHGASHIAVGNLTFRGLGVAGGGGGISTSCGIGVDGEGADIRIDNVDTAGFGGSGINVCHDLSQTGNKNSGRYRDVSVRKCSAHDNGFGGVDIINCTNVLVDSVDASYNVGYAYILDTGSGFGIRLWACSHAVVQNCKADYDHRGTSQGGSTAAIEADGSSYVLFQHDETSHDHQGIFDGDGIVFDGVRYGVMQFNTTRDNDGCGLFIGGDSTCGSGDYCTARYNISQNDARDRQPYAGALVFGDIDHSYFYNNTIYSTASQQPALKIWVPGDQWARGRFGTVCLANNNLVTTGNPLVFLQLDAGNAAPPVRFACNNYWAAGSPFKIDWGKTSYATLSDFRSGARQEKLDGSDQGFEADPQFVKADAGNFTIADGSPLAKAGLSLSAFGTTWDPYHFAGDPFLGPFFNATPTDVYGIPLPGSNPSVGASQVASGK